MAARGPQLVYHPPSRQSPQQVGRKGLYGVLVFLAVFVAVTFPKAFASFKTDLRMRQRRHQQVKLEEILAAKGPRFSGMYVHGSLSGDMYLSGPVRSTQDAAELQSEIVKRLGPEVGKSVHLNVRVPGPNQSLGGQDQLKSRLAGTTRPTQEK
jgi:hypothetical protein